MVVQYFLCQICHKKIHVQEMFFSLDIEQHFESLAPRIVRFAESATHKYSTKLHFCEDCRNRIIVMLDAMAEQKQKEGKQ